MSPNTGSAGISTSQQMASKTTWSVVLIGFLAVFLDGFDAASLAFSIPALSTEWGAMPATFTLPLVLTNLGAVAGYMGAGWLGARVGRPTLLMVGIAIFTVLTLITAATLPLHSIPLLTVLRLCTGIGLGIVLPAAVGLATQNSPASRSELVSLLVTLGLASGATAGGFAGGSLISMAGTAGVFWVAGVLPLILLAIAPAMIPKDTAQNSLAEAKDNAKFTRLLAKELRTDTVVLWFFAFTTFVATYTLSSWAPTLLSGYGFSPAEAPLGTAFLSLGGIIGGIGLIPLSGRFGTPRVLVVLCLLSALAILAAALLPLSKPTILIALGLAGAGITAGCIGQLAIAVALYPDLTRTTGVGWAAAMGRAGSILGPAIAGVLLTLSFSGSSIFLSTTVPALLAGLAALVLYLRLRSRQSNIPVLENKAESQ